MRKWRGHFGNHHSEPLWKFILSCLMWCIWREMNDKTCENCEKSVVDLNALYFKICYTSVASIDCFYIPSFQDFLLPFTFSIQVYLVYTSYESLDDLDSIYTCTLDAQAHHQLLVLESYFGFSVILYASIFLANSKFLELMVSNYLEEMNIGEPVFSQLDARDLLPSVSDKIPFGKGGFHRTNEVAWKANPLSLSWWLWLQMNHRTFLFF